MYGTNPFRELEALRREVDRLFEGVASPPKARSAFLPGRSARSYPLINIQESADGLTVEALAPGVDPASLEVAIEDGSLVIAGEKPRPAQDVSPEAWHRSERAAGRFLRKIKLAVPVDEENVAAEYRNGVLAVKLHKAEAAKPRRIAVNVA
jgi:HSP20 family protein